MADESTRTPEIERLPWDSDFFGFSVGRLSASFQPDRPEQVQAVQRQAATKLLYWSTTSASDSFDPWKVLDQVTLRKDSLAKQPVSLPESYVAEEYSEEVASDQLLDLALAAGWSSRFRVDKRLSEDRFREMYRIWIDRSCSGEIAESVQVIRGGDELAAMATLGIKDGAGSIGLLAVSGKHRRRGLGRALLQLVENVAVEHSCAGISVVTQSHNEGAMQLYQAGGYCVSQVLRWYHFWMDDDA